MAIQERPIMDDNVFRELRDMVYQWTGIYLPEKKKYFLESSLMKRLEENLLPDFKRYLKFLRDYANGSERLRFIDAVTTKETSFFREKEHFEAMAEIIIQKRLLRPRVLSVGCATGEEPYTVAIVFKERGIRGEIYGMDISDSAIKTAKKAVYTDYSLRSTPEEIIKKYFKGNGTYELKDDIKSMVRFYRGSIIEWSDIKQFKGVDFVFCRNVFIYFDDMSRQKAFENIYEVLRPGGILFLGISETGYRSGRLFRPLKIKKIVAYERL